MDDARVTFYGTRGSMPIAGHMYDQFGGATSCVLLELGGQIILLDAGSGLLGASGYFSALPGGTATLLLSHSHLDHIMGLLSFGALSREQWQFDICGPVLSGLSVRQQLTRLMSPPLWPVGPGDAFAPQTRYIDLKPGTFHIGPVRVTAQVGNHPGGAYLYRLEHGGKSVVYATDFEHTKEALSRLEPLARGCDLLIMDAQFSDAEYQAFAMGWGHATWEAVTALSRQWGVKRTRMFHHSRKLDDDALLEREVEARALNANCAFARSMEVVAF